MNSISSAKKHIWPVACLVVLAVYLLTVPRTWQCEGVDEIEYLGLGHSLATGYGYTMYGEPYGLYPPLFPAMMSVVQRVNATAWPSMYAINAGLGFLGLVYLSTWIRRTYGRVGRWASWFALAAYYPWSFSTRYLLAEQLFVLFSCVVLVQLDRALRSDRISRRTWLLVSVCVLLAAMTKASAVALLAAVGISCGAAWLARKNRAALGLAVLVTILAGGFMLGWETRAHRVDPNAPESYGRWMLKLVGLSKETTGLVGQNLGEGAEGKATAMERADALAFKLGPYLTSVVRPPDNFKPLAILLSTLCGIGILRELRARACSPLAVYAAVSLVMICLTSWVSSYHRYLYPLTPLLFLFLFRGAAVVVRARWGVLLWATFGVFGLWWTWQYGLASGTDTEARYAQVMGVLVAAGYAALFVTSRMAADRRVGVLIAGAFAGLVLHNGALVTQRFRQTLGDATPRERNLTGAIACGEFLKANSAPGATCVSSLPRMMEFLSDRHFSPPGSTGDYVVILGELRGIPAFRPEAEAALVERMRASGLVPVFASGDAAVYKWQEKSD